MKQTAIIMGTPIIIEITDKKSNLGSIFDKVFDYFCSVDNRFSTYKENSEISQINRGELNPIQYSPEMTEVLGLCESMKTKTHGFFDIKTPAEIWDPSGLVKGWSIFNASKILDNEGIDNYYVSAGGDVQVKGLSSKNKPWEIGIMHPWENDKIVKTVSLTKGGIATSGTYIRGTHIYNPKTRQKIDNIVSLSVIGPDVYQADVFATAAFAMGKNGIYFIEKQPGFAGYMIDNLGTATPTTNFDTFSKP